MNTLRHQGVLYDGPDDFVRMVLPFVREGIETGDPVIAVAPKPSADALREALGDGAEEVELRYSHDWYLSPGKSLRGFLGFALDHPDATWVRMVGEPVWPVDWRAGIDEYAHYESVFNVVARDTATWALCPYDTAKLPDTILEHALATHPEIRAGTRLDVNPGYVDPDTYCAQLADGLSSPAAEARRIALTPDLRRLRALVEAEAAAAGVRGDRLRDFLTAVHEVLVNALVHGTGQATMRLWDERLSFICEVDSEGPTVSETTAGYIPVRDMATGGRGLWIARQLCDLVQIHSRHGRTSVRLHALRA